MYKTSVIEKNPHCLLHFVVISKEIFNSKQLAFETNCKDKTLIILRWWEW